MEKFRKWYRGGILHMAGAAVLSFAAFYILFGVSMDVTKGIVLVATLLAVSLWFFSRGFDMYSAQSSRNGR